ncbi:MAG: bifunctional DNA primase/polymerase [Planctomycetota bacterium]
MDETNVAAEPEMVPGSSAYVAEVLRLASWLRNSGLGVGMVPGEHRDGRKKPRITKAVESASLDQGQLSQWWARWPDALVMLVTGRRLLVLDIDMKNGKDGRASLAQLCKDLGVDLPMNTATAMTANGAMHIYLRLPAGSAQGIKPSGFAKRYPGIDLQTGKKPVVAPPSPHQSGGGYAWAAGRSVYEVGIEPIPAPLLSMLSVPQVERRNHRPNPKSERYGRSPNIEVVREMLDHLSGHSDRLTWLYVGMGLHQGFGGSSGGQQLWDQWSQQSPDSYDSAEIVRQWDCFNEDGDLTLEAVAGWAKAAGWPMVDLHAAEAPPKIETTLPVARSGQPEALQEIARSGVSFEPGTRSVAFSGPPGLSKTRTARAWAVELLGEGRVGTVIMAVAKRARVNEVCGDMGEGPLEDQLLAAGARLAVAMGRGKDPDGPFYCSFAASSVYERRAQLGRTSCRGDSQHARECQYLKGQEAAHAAISEDGPSLVVTTIDYLRHLRPALEQAGRDDAVLILDDPGAEFGLFTDSEFHRGPLDDYRDRIGRWLADHPAASSELVRLGGLLRDVVGCLLDDDGGVDRLAHFAGSMSEGQRGLVADCETGAGSAMPWESKPDQPAFSLRLFGLLRQAVEGRPGAVKRGKSGKLIVAEANTLVIDKAQQGRCLWLSVGPMMEFVVQALGIERRHAEWSLSNRIVRLKLPRGYKGRGAPVGQEPSKSDELFRLVASGLSQSFGNGLGVLTTKVSFEHLAPSLEEHGSRVGYYNSHHAGTNTFDHAEVMLVQRYRPHPAECAWLTAAMEGVLGLPMSPLEASEAAESLVRWERRWCPAAQRSYGLKVPRDPRARQVYRTLEAQLMVNAVGRCRPMTNPSSTIVLFDSDPVEGVEATEEVEVVGLDLLRDPEGLMLTWSSGPRALRHRDLVRQVLDRGPATTTTEIHEKVLKDWVVDLDGDPPSLRATESLLRGLGGVDSSPSGSSSFRGRGVSYSRDPKGVEDMGDGGSLTDLVDHPVVSDVLAPGWRHERKRKTIKQIIETRTRLSSSTVQRCLRRLRNHEGIPTTTRADSKRNFLKVQQALSEVVEEMDSVVASGS